MSFFPHYLLIYEKNLNKVGEEIFRVFMEILDAMKILDECRTYSRRL